MVPLTDKLLRIPSAMGLAYTLTTTGRIFVSARADVDVQRTRNKSGIGALSVDARPVVEAALTHETTLEMPFARSFAVAGARVTASAALPIRTNHEVNWRSKKYNLLRIGRFACSYFEKVRRFTAKIPE